MRRRWLIIGLLIIVAVIVFVTVSQNTGTNPALDSADMVVAERKVIVASVTASGSISPVEDVTLNFSMPGTVDEVLVSEGDLVRKGDVLARLESDELALAVQQARQALVIQQIAYEQTISPNEMEIEAAQAQLDSALANVGALLRPDPLQLDISRLQAQTVDEERRQVELQWDRIKDEPLGGVTRDTLQSQFAQAVLQAQIAQLQNEIVARGGTAEQVAAARAQVAQAQAALERLSPDERTIALAEAQVRQAELNLELAALRVENVTLLAPFDATVAVVTIVDGQAVSPGAQPAFVLADLTAFHIDVGVDEIDIGRLIEGQLVEIEVDALPDFIIGGSVARIAPTARETAGVVSYIVTVEVDPTDAPIRAGMNSIVNVITEIRDDVLVIPNRMIRIDRSTGRSYVNVLRGDQAFEVEIVTGLRSDLESEVLQGLNEGDVLVILPSGPQLPFGG